MLPLLREAGVDAGSFDADEDEGRDDHGVADLLGHGAQVVGVEVGGEHAGVEGEQHDEDEGENRDDLEDGDDPVDDRRVTDAAGDQVVEQPDAERGDPDREQGVAVTEGGEEGADRRGHEDPVEGVPGAGAGPEADGGVEAHVVAEAGLGVDEHTGVELGLADGQGLEDEGEHQHAGSGDQPGDQGGSHPGCDAEPGGQENTPAPTIDPTTIAVRTVRVTF